MVDEQILRQINERPESIAEVDWVEFSHAFDRDALWEIVRGIRDDKQQERAIRLICNEWRVLFTAADARCYIPIFPGPPRPKFIHGGDSSIRHFLESLRKKDQEHREAKRMLEEEKRTVLLEIDFQEKWAAKNSTNALNQLSRQVQQELKELRREVPTPITNAELDAIMQDGSAHRSHAAGGTPDGTQALEARIRALEARIGELEEENARLREQAEERTEEKMNWHDKVRLELLLSLLERDGADTAKHGGKTKAAEVLNMLTGLPMSTCKNFCTCRSLSHTHHEDEILRLNSKLQALGMDSRL